jgi:hypothetical protein
VGQESWGRRPIPCLLIVAFGNFPRQGCLLSWSSTMRYQSPVLLKMNITGYRHQGRSSIRNCQSRRRTQGVRHLFLILHRRLVSWMRRMGQMPTSTYSAYWDQSICPNLTPGSLVGASKSVWGGGVLDGGVILWRHSTLRRTIRLRWRSGVSEGTWSSLTGKV